MAYGKKTGGRDFKPGQSGNPKGPAKTGIVQARKMTSLVFSEIVIKYMNLTLEQVNEKFKDPSTPALDLIVLKILYEGIKKGDQVRLGFLLERTIGKVKEVINYSFSPSQLSDEQLIEETAKLLKEVKGNK